MATGFDIADNSGKVCAGLDSLGCQYYLEADNRGGKRASQYIIVRKPVAAKIRVSDHRSNWVERNAGRSKTVIVDVGPHGVTWQDAVKAIEELVNPLRQ